MKGFIYLITRKDGQQYVGITYDMKKRMREHSYSERFKMGIESVSIIKECETYTEASELEEKYIEEYDTFRNGLNRSKNGKGNHLAPSFTTLGFKYSDESKKKMSENNWIKRGGTNPMLGKEHKEETKKSWSDTRKGKCWGPRKIPLEDALMIKETYKKDLLVFDDEFIIDMVKKTDRERVGKDPIESLKSPNGKHLNKKILYAYYYSKIYNVTRQNILRILSREMSENAK